MRAAAGGIRPQVPETFVQVGGARDWAAGVGLRPLVSETMRAVAGGVRPQVSETLER
ncbi:MAG: hypothetical protein LBK00_03450 [Treponema sp.]|nr:hypothetical protein [Treponema sp.]